MLVGVSLCFAAASGFAPTPLPRWPPSVTVASVPLSSPRLAVAHMAAGSADSADMAAGSADSAEQGRLPLSALVPFLTLVSVKTATDLVTNHVVRPPATAMALVAELSIFPLIVLWLAAANGLRLLRRLGGSDDSASPPPRNIRAVFTSALEDRQGCLDLLGIGAVYALDGLVYFYAHSNVGAVTYTVLAQTKIFFTVAALRMRGMLPKLTLAQFAGLAALFFGATLVSLKDVATGVAATSGNRAIGIACLLLGQACTSLANVAYEKRLRSPGADLWVRNVQLTASISLWLAVSSAVRASLILASGGVPPPPRELLAAFCGPWVWLVVALKAVTAVLIALTISAGGNVLRLAQDRAAPRRRLRPISPAGCSLTA
jgi:drug/metabolite transporter (DMT)-like permease